MDLYFERRSRPVASIGVALFAILALFVWAFSAQGQVAASNWTDCPSATACKLDNRYEVGDEQAGGDGDGGDDTDSGDDTGDTGGGGGDGTDTDTTDGGGDGTTDTGDTGAGGGGGTDTSTDDGGGETTTTGDGDGDDDGDGDGDGDGTGPGGGGPGGGTVPDTAITSPTNGAPLPALGSLLLLASAAAYRVRGVLFGERADR